MSISVSLHPRNGACLLLHQVKQQALSWLSWMRHDPTRDHQACPNHEEVPSMPSPTMRVPAPVKEIVEGLAEQMGTTPQAVLARAVESYKYQVFLRRAADSAAAIQAQPELWARLQAERAETDLALSAASAEPELAGMALSR